MAGMTTTLEPLGCADKTRLWRATPDEERIGGKRETAEEAKRGDTETRRRGDAEKE
jgi:hypothetical protein